MSCPFCDAFASYQRQTGRRLKTHTFAMSEENAHRLVHMAVQIHKAARTTLGRVGNEAVPTILCDLLDGLAEGLMEGLAGKLVQGAHENCHATTSNTLQPRPAHE